MIWFRSLLFLVVFYSWTTVLALAFWPLHWLFISYDMRELAAFWQRGVIRILKYTVGLTFEVQGPVSPQPVIYAVKHQSAFETLVFHTIHRDIAIPLKYELTRIPIFGSLLMRAGHIRIERHGRASAMRQLLHDARTALEDGRSIVIFPEGTRTAPGAKPDYKPGIAALYTHLGYPVIPVALNTGVFWPRRTLRKLPGKAVIQFLEPIQPGLNRKQFMQSLQTRIESATTDLLIEGRASLSREEHLRQILNP